MDLSYPFRGRWLVQNSPADRVPSHGTTAFATSWAIDFVPVDHHGRTAPFRPISMARPEAPELFPGFGRPVLSPADGLVIAAADDAVDHHAYRGFPSVGYALTQARRASGGWRMLTGNHVLIRTPDGPIVALCHLQHGSARVKEGDRVRVGQEVARCGNTGNSSEPHVHLQVMDGPDASRARAIPVSFDGGLPRNREVIEV